MRHVYEMEPSLFVYTTLNNHTTVGVKPRQRMAFLSEENKSFREL